MNTEKAEKYLDELQIYDRSVYDSKDIEHPLECLLEDYHQERDSLRTEIEKLRDEIKPLISGEGQVYLGQFHSRLNKILGDTE